MCILQGISRKGYKKNSDSNDQVILSLTNQIWDDVNEYYKVKYDNIPDFFKAKVIQQTKRCNLSGKGAKVQAKSKSPYFFNKSYWMEERNTSGVRRSRENQCFMKELRKCEKV